MSALWNTPPIPLATRSPSSAFTSVTRTRAPWAARSSAIARPMPLAAPVTMATRPLIGRAVYGSEVLAPSVQDQPAWRCADGRERLLRSLRHAHHRSLVGRGARGEGLLLQELPDRVHARAGGAG